MKLTKTQRKYMVQTAKDRIARDAEKYKRVIDIQETDKISIAKGIWGL